MVRVVSAWALIETCRPELTGMCVFVVQAKQRHNAMKKCYNQKCRNLEREQRYFLGRRLREEVMSGKALGELARKCGVGRLMSGTVWLFVGWLGWCLWHETEDMFAQNNGRTTMICRGWRLL